MNRSSSPASDNIFLRSYASLKSKSVRLTGTLVLLAVLPLVAVLAFSLGLGYLNLKRDMATQADAVGRELARQVAVSVADAMADNDNLSLNIILAQWNQNPLIAHAAVYTLDNRVVAEAGQRTPPERLAPGQGRFISAIHYQDAVTGQLHLSLAAEPLAGPTRNLLRLLLLSIIAIAVIAGLIAWRLALRLRSVLVGLGEYHGDADLPAPGAQRKDELGDLARRLAQRRIVDMPEPETPEPAEATADEPARTEPSRSEVSLADVPLVTEAISAQPDDQTTDSEDDDITATFDHDSGTHPAAPRPDAADADPSAIESTEAIEAEPEQAPLLHSFLAVRLGNLDGLRRLPRPRLLALLERYRQQVQQASQIYDAELSVLDDGTSVLRFAAEDADDAQALTRALSCGELLRVLGHELQVAISDTGVNLFLQLALSQSADAQLESDSESSQEHDGQAQLTRMLELLQFSRNLLLLDVALADQSATRDRAVIRRLASQSGTYCVERLNEPYQTLLERNLNQLYSQRPD